jgi:hypothetical protein
MFSTRRVSLLRLGVPQYPFLSTTVAVNAGVSDQTNSKQGETNSDSRDKSLVLGNSGPPQQTDASIWNADSLPDSREANQSRSNTSLR